MRKNITLLLLMAFNVYSCNALSQSLKFITIDVAPWAHTDAKSGKIKGEFIDIVKEIQKRSGYDITISLTPFARVDREMETGGHDCTILVPRDKSSVVYGDVVSYHDVGIVPKKQ